jgi:hypothetical protein
VTLAGPTGHKNRVVDLENAQIIDALQGSRGVIKDAALTLKCDRSQLSRRISGDDELKQVRKDVFETFVDEVEHKYYDKMMATEKESLLIFFMKCHGKKRGWVERQELTGAEGTPLGEVVAPVRQLTAEDWAKENLRVVG